MHCFDFNSRYKWFVHLPPELAKIANEYVGPELFGKSWTVNHPEFTPYMVQTIVGDDIIWALHDNTGDFVMRNLTPLPILGHVQYVNKEWIRIGNALLHLASERVVILTMVDPVVYDNKLYYIRDQSIYSLPLNHLLSNNSCELDVWIRDAIKLQVVGHSLNIDFEYGTGVLGHTTISLKSSRTFEWHGFLFHVDNSRIGSDFETLEFRIAISYVIPDDKVLFVHCCGLKSFLVHWNTMQVTELDTVGHLQRAGNRLFSTENGLRVYE